MKEYEVIWEIFNKCPRNQMRDVFVEEVEIADPEEYVFEKSFPQSARPLCWRFHPNSVAVARYDALI